MRKLWDWIVSAILMGIVVVGAMLLMVFCTNNRVL